MYSWISEKPYIEFHAGRKLRKVTPSVAHAMMETSLSQILSRCCEDRGVALIECHFDMSIQLGTKTILVPDVAFVRRERLFGYSDDYLQIPAFAPDVAVEIRSPSDRRGEREWKIATYLAAESLMVLDVSPPERTIHAHTKDGVTSFGRGDIFTHDAVPWLTFSLDDAFKALDVLSQQKRPG